MAKRKVKLVVTLGIRDIDTLAECLNKIILFADSVEWAKKKAREAHNVLANAVGRSKP